MTNPELIRTAVTEYVRLLEQGTAAELSSLFVDDAFIVDPVGSDPKVGRKAIRAHFDRVEPLEMQTKLLALRIAGDSAAAFFQVTTKIGMREFVSAPIDVFKVAEDGRIASLGAYWGEHDYTAS